MARLTAVPNPKYNLELTQREVNYLVAALLHVRLNGSAEDPVYIALLKHGYAGDYTVEQGSGTVKLSGPGLKGD